MKIKSWGRLIACPSPTKKVGKTNRKVGQTIVFCRLSSGSTVASEAAENEKSSTQQGNRPPDAKFAMQKRSHPNQRTGCKPELRTVSVLRSAGRKRKGDPLTKQKRLMYYLCTLGKGASLSNT